MVSPATRGQGGHGDGPLTAFGYHPWMDVSCPLSFGEDCWRKHKGKELLYVVYITHSFIDCMAFQMVGQ